VDSGGVISNGPIRRDQFTVNIAQYCPRRTQPKEKASRTCKGLNVACGASPEGLKPMKDLPFAASPAQERPDFVAHFAPSLLHIVNPESTS
jgi:hypothetical protein